MIPGEAITLQQNILDAQAPGACTLYNSHHIMLGNVTIVQGRMGHYSQTV